MVKVVSSRCAIEGELHVSVCVYSSCREVKSLPQPAPPLADLPGMTSFPVASTTLASLATPSRSQPTFLRGGEAVGELVYAERQT